MKISRENLPIRGLPIFQTLTMYLFLDKMEAAGWVWGVIGTFGAFWWLATIITLYKEETINIFKHFKVVDPDPITMAVNSKFQKAFDAATRAAAEAKKNSK